MSRRLLPVVVFVALAMTILLPARANEAVRRLAQICGRAASVAPAHHGTPVAIATSQAAGPYTVSLWATPETGDATLYVVVVPRDGVLMPREVRVALRAVSGADPTRVVRAYPESVRNGARFVAALTLPRVDSWQARVVLDGASGPGELHATFASVAPASTGLAGLALATLPFVLVAGLWGPLRLVRRPPFATRPASNPSL